MAEEVVVVVDHERLVESTFRQFVERRIHADASLLHVRQAECGPRDVIVGGGFQLSLELSVGLTEMLAGLAIIQLS